MEWIIKKSLTNKAILLYYFQFHNCCCSSDNENTSFGRVTSTLSISLNFQSILIPATIPFSLKFRFNFIVSAFNIPSIVILNSSAC